MPNENVLNYLRENKDKFSQEVLRKRLIGAGYPQNQIEEGIRIVYGGATVPPPTAIAKTSFWDFKNVKIYKTFGEKLLDFLVGFFTPSVLVFVLSFLFGGVINFLFRGFYYFPFSFVIWLCLFLAIFGTQVWAIFYLWKRRHYFARGLLFCLILPLILIGIGAFILFFVFGFGSYWF